jgi:hypothetical protein
MPDPRFWRVKTIDWKDEEEYRIMRLLRDRIEEAKIRAGKVVYLFHLPRTCIKGVYLGHRLDGIIENRIRHALAGTTAVLYSQQPSHHPL